MAAAVKTFLLVFGLMLGAGFSTGSILTDDLYSLYGVLGFLLMAVFMGALLMEAAAALRRPQPTAIERIQIMDKPKRTRKSAKIETKPVNVAFVKTKKDKV